MFGDEVFVVGVVAPAEEALHDTVVPAAAIWWAKNAPISPEAPAISAQGQ
jgi:hypothetical protein